MNKNLEIAQNVLNLIGGKENVERVFYCATRLRFYLKDISKVNEPELKATPGVLGIVNSGGMYQVVIGQNVEKVYDHLCQLGNFTKNDAIDEVLDEGLQKKGIKKIAEGILSYFVSSMTPIINILMGGCLWNTLSTILGPTMLNVIAADSEFAVTATMIYNTVFYFLPIYIGYGAAKALKINNPLWGMVIGGLTIVPTFTGMAGTTETFKLFGLISVPVADYGQSVIPILLGMVVFKYVYNFLKKIIPDLVFSLFASFIIFFVMAIVMLLAFCPLGTIIGNVISNVFMAMSNANWFVRTLAYVLLTGSWAIITLCGMHLPIAFAAFAIIAQTGCDTFSCACMTAGVAVLNGMSIGAIFKYKEKNNKTEAISAAVAANIGGICEPTLYSICLRNSSSTKVMIIGGALAGLVASILRPICYNIAAGGAIFNLIGPWTGGTAANAYKGLANTLIAMTIGFLGTILFAKEEKAK